MGHGYIEFCLDNFFSMHFSAKVLLLMNYYHYPSLFLTALTDGGKNQLDQVKTLLILFECAERYSAESEMMPARLNETKQRLKG